MGYETQYQLQIRDPKTYKLLEDETFRTVIIGQLRDECDEAKYSLTLDGDRTGDECRWHEHEKDMSAFSKKYPLFLFVLDGEGEQSGYIWRKYFWNGRMQHEKASLQIAPFDPSKFS